MPLERIPPQNVDAEQALLGALMLDGDAIFHVVEHVRTSDFYKDAHRIIFDCFLTLNERNEPVDLVTLVEELRRRGDLEKVGGLSYVAALANAVPTAANATYYAKIVAEKALLRSLISVSTKIAQHGYEQDLEAAELIDEAEKMIFSVTQRKTRDGFVAMRDVVVEAFEQIGRTKAQDGVTGLPTFRNLDYYLSGLQKSDLVIVAARPAMGKTSFCLNIAQNLGVKHDKTVAIFSLEMSKGQLAQRMLCGEARVDQSKVRTGYVNEEEWGRLSVALAPLAEAKIYLDDTPGITVMEMRAKARRLKAEKGLDLIVIDYIQLMQGNRRSENRQQEISEISRSLKALARELDVPVMALSQLSRAVEQSADKRPNLSHLRESGALEQDADIVIFIHRPEYYDPDTEQRGIAEIIVAKHRNGPVGTAELAFIKEYTKFMDLAKEPV
ncbi:replicative DNA helicase [Dehalobacterium formicoaceticum]|uniref:Replicative DNA helicase n=1 Tax=Dehalobacterium formicoaceticum TaxID=51515 RepID=A0ABT1Y3U4_9FIRM|nr:replicative DNA helicase [Dehalobacterium formicoaceticum]MCR6545542.1 replicative DNA helicase [Dehalobacterium formicoaceticum]